MFRKVFDKITDFCFPDNTTCAFCKRDALNISELGLCEECQSQLVFCDEDVTISSDVGLDGFCSGLIYTGNVTQGAVRMLKFSDAIWFAPLLAKTIKLPTEWKIDVIIPVPLHKKRRRERGYNQSECIARNLSKIYDIPIRTDLMERTVYTAAQSHNMSAENRKHNTVGVFAASDEVFGLNILVVDDVATTGSTLKNCAKTLFEAGAMSVYAATACVTYGHESDEPTKKR